MSQADTPAADWYPDPSGRFQFRYWDGETWTGHVSTDGTTEWDPPGDGASGETEDLAPDVGADPVAGSSGAEAEVARAGDAEVGDAQAGDAEVGDARAGDAEVGDAQPGSAATADQQWAAQTAAADQPAQGGTIEEGEPADTNLVANQRAGLDADVEAWLDEVAGQVEPRLSRIEQSWTSQPQAEAARACAYGLLIGHLAHLHPHMRDELASVAESHPSFTTLEAGARLDTLEQIARDRQRTAAWLGPLIGNEDVDRVTMLFD
ncbi:MAG TPA: DUF2510 domain-containing protein [Euzebya sp.]|nr:DUF2510 domain-containing protein [Euzebya sp.]